MVEDSNNKANSEELEASQQDLSTPQEEPQAQAEEANPAEGEAPKTEEVPAAEAGAPEVPAQEPEAVKTEAEPAEAAVAEPAASEEVTTPETPTEEASKPEAAPASEEGEAQAEDAGDGDDDEEEHEEEDEDFDYSNHTKEQLVGVVEALHQSDDLRKVGRILKELRTAFDEILKVEEAEAKQKYLDEGGEADGFEFRPDEHMTRFEKAYTALDEKVRVQRKAHAESKASNLHKKNELLEKLRELVDGEESNASIKSVKAIQEEWKTVGPVPPQHNKNLWANYNALLDRYYDNRSIYFELKELDRKKNLESKNELVKRAEALSEVENLKDAIKDLNELHEEFKHIGPVPKEDQEALWQRFKGASDKVYDRRREFLGKLKEDLNKNLEAKQKLGEEVQSFISFDSDRINEWNKKTKEILAVQKQWEAIGGLPRDKAKDVNKLFWTAFKTFFNHKNQFFKKLEGQREENLKKKQDLVAQADALKDNSEWDKTAEELKRLQKEWREIGPVPEKFRDSVFEEFKTACDHFFTARRSANNEKESEFHDNLKAKEEICSKISAMGSSKEIDTEQLEDLMDEYAEIGFVPRNAIKKVQQKFAKAVETVLEKADIEDFERERIRMNITVNKIKGGPNANRKIHRKEDAIRKQMRQLEDNIAQWENNLTFFASSATADKLKAEFDEKIANAREEIKKLRAQLRVLREA